MKSREKKPTRRRRGIFEREAIAVTVWLFGLPLVGLLVAIAAPQVIKWMGAPHSPAVIDHHSD